MVKQFITLQGFTRENRHAAIRRVKDAMLRGGAFVTDFQMFSDVAVRLDFEVEVGHLGDLSAALAAEKVLDEQSRDRLAFYSGQRSRLGEKALREEVAGTVNITFFNAAAPK